VGSILKDVKKIKKIKHPKGCGSNPKGKNNKRRTIRQILGGLKEEKNAERQGKE